MFHEGDLQSGIATAIQQQKLVTCFVHDDSATSEDWETKYLPQHAQVIQQKTVLLKLRQNSQEASFLAAFCPVTTAPTLVVIDNGRVVQQIGPEVSAEEWQARFQKALGVSSQQQHNNPITDSPAKVGTSVEVPESNSKPQAGVSVNEATIGAGQEKPEPAVSDGHTAAEEEAARRQAEEKAARIAAAEVRRREIEAAQPRKTNKGKQPMKESDDSPPTARTDWIELQSKRKQEAKAERERILAQIQADRAEQKLRSTRPVNYSSLSQPTSAKVSQGNSPGSSSLQVRLVDGSSIRRQFSAEQTLQDVREWITEAASEDSITKAYTFRQLLIPQPSRAIDAMDEGKSLRELGLTPSATLVVSPVEVAVSAIGGSNILMRAISTLLGILASLFAWLTSLGRRDVLERTDSGDMSTATTTGNDARPASSRRRTTTFADSKAGDEDSTKPNEFYNGNSSAFQSRKDDDQ